MFGLHNIGGNIHIHQEKRTFISGDKREGTCEINRLKIRVVAIDSIINRVDEQENKQKVWRSNSALPERMHIEKIEYR